MHHVHLTRELLHAVSEGRRNPGDLADLTLGHLLHLCEECEREFDAFRREADEQGHAFLHPVSVERSVEWAKGKAQEVALERREAGPKLAALLALPERQRLVVIREAPQEYRGPALAELLIDASRAKLPGSPADSAALAELAAVLLEHTEWSPIVVELYARATAYMANALRIAGRLRDASRLFHTARFLLRYEGGGDAIVRAELDNLEGILLRGQRRFAEAEELLGRSVAAFLRQGLLVQGARSLLNLGIMHQELRNGERAAKAAEEALELLDADEQPNLYFIARHNLVHAICEQGRFEEARAMFGEVENLHRRHGDALSLLRLALVEGKIARGLGERDAAESSFLAARHGFLRHGIAYDAALVSLELALLYLEEGRTAEVRELAAEMVEVFEQQEIHREATVALGLFRDAVELERASATLVRQLMSYLMQARHDPSFAFQEAS
jgi:tetratricopeptide (TPR) repeat protein